MQAEYQVIIIGGGPAGLSAAIYTGRSRLRTLLIEKGIMGGRLNEAELIENYPGFPEGINGMELTQKMHQQAEKYGVETLASEVSGIDLEDTHKVVKTDQGNFKATAIIIACGSKHITLNVPGEKEYTGKGVSYCATCDAYFFKDMPVAVVGGGNTAVNEALYLTKFASRVVLIHRRRELRATPIVQERAFTEPKIEILWDTVVEVIEGKGTVKRLILRNVSTSETHTIDIDGVFVAIGIKPSTDIFKETLTQDNDGYIIVNDKMESSVPGIFAAGDIRSGSIRQVITAAGDGAIAAVHADFFISEKFLLH
jgi:thioredoxin reductase (NADPH)